MTMFRILFGIDCLIAAMLAALFIASWAEGGVSAFEAALWLVVLGGIAAIMGLSVRLHARGNMVAAKILLMILAGPGLGGGMFVLTMLTLQPSWR